MGNRAVIALESMPTVGIYLHWNGGLESVLAFLEATKKRGARSPGSDSTYCFARLTQAIGEFFSTQGDYEHCVGVGPLSILDTDNGDNGLYWIGDEWQIMRREYAEDYAEQVSLGDLCHDEMVVYEGIVAEIMGATKPRVDPLSSL